MSTNANIERDLINDLRVIRLRRQDVRCIYVRDKNFLKGQEENFIKIVKGLLEKQDIKFYFCFKSVFVIAPEIPFKSFTAITKSLGLLLEHEIAADDKDIVLMDTAKDWDAFFSFVESELEEKEEAEKQKPQPVAATVYPEGKKQDEMQKPQAFVMPKVEATIDFKSLRRNRDKKVVLVVEDDRFMGSLVFETIGDKYTKFVARCGKEAIDTYIAQAPDIVFLDIELPDMNGYDVLKYLRAMDKDIFAVMLSGHGTKDNVTAAVEYKVKGFISKPFSKEKLVKYLSMIS